MLHDSELIEQLLKITHEPFTGEVYRTTGVNADPTAFSTSGGRWAIPEESSGGFSILYTSFDRDGSIAEVASYLKLLTPIPLKPLKVSKLSISAERAIRVDESHFQSLGIDPEKYAERNYESTQLVGAAVNFLQLDCLIAPSARWRCNNLMIFANNHSLASKLEVIGSEIVEPPDWQSLDND